MRTTISEETIKRLMRYAVENISLPDYWGYRKPAYLITKKGENKYDNMITIDRAISYLLEERGY